MSRRKLFQIFLLLGCLFRLLCLGDRPLHNDESVHAILSYDWFVMPAVKFYRYDPRFHGPFLYEVLRWFFALFGVGEIQARLVPALSGCLVFLSPLLFRKWLGNTAALIALMLLASSPLNVYYSRFLCHDEMAILFVALSLYGFLRYRDDASHRLSGLPWLALCAASAGIVFATKAVGFLYVFLLGTFGLLWWGWDRLARRSFRLPIKRLAKGSSVFTVVFLLSYAYLQTSFFQNPSAFADGLYREIFKYWWGQHDVERLYAPLNYHLRSLALHELPILVGLTLGWLYGFRRITYCRITFLLVVIAGFILLPLSREMASRGSLFIFLKARSLADLFPYVFAFGLGASGTIAAIQRRNWPLALACYWSFGSIAVYSYVGEKVPWLTIHIVYPAALFCGYLFSNLFKHLTQANYSRWNRLAQRTALVSLVLLGFYQIRLAYFVNFITAGEPVDLLTQMHTHRNVKDVMEWIHRSSVEAGLQPNKFRVGLFGGMPTWSFLFYLITQRYQDVVFEPTELSGKERFIIANNEISKRIGPGLRKKGYLVTELINAGAWLPQNSAMTFTKWVSYALNRVADGNYVGEPMFVYHLPR